VSFILRFKTALIITALLYSNYTFAFIFAEAESKKAYELAEGLATAANLIEEINLIKNNGFDVEELLSISSGLDDEILKLEQLATHVKLTHSGYHESKKFKDKVERSAELLRRSARLIGILCSRGVHGCTAATAHSNTMEVRNVNASIVDLHEEVVKQALKKDMKEIQMTAERVKLLNSIRSFPFSWVQGFINILDKDASLSVRRNSLE